MKKYMFSVLVQNNPGVLARVSSLFARRGYNIDSLTVSPTNNLENSKITVAVMGDDEILEKVLKQVSKLEETLSIVQVEETTSICKELIMVRLQADEKDNHTCTQVNNVVAQFRATMLKKDVNSVTLELADVPSRVEAFMKSLNAFRVLEMCRTGVTAITS